MAWIIIDHTSGEITFQCIRLGTVINNSKFDAPMLAVLCKCHGDGNSFPPVSVQTLEMYLLFHRGASFI